MGSIGLGEKIIAEANQVSNSVDRRGHSDRYFPFGSRKSGNEMSVYFGRNANDKIGMNPLKSIWSPSLQVNSTIMINQNIFNLVIRVLLWNVTTKSEIENLVENLKDNRTNLIAKIISKLKILDNIDSVLKWIKKYSDSI